MKEVSVEKLKPGDVVAKDVTTKNGTLLVKAGTELTPELIERLKKLNVPWIYIKVTEGIEEYQEKIKFFKERLDKLDILFRKHNSNEFMLKMKIFFKNYFKSRIFFMLKEIKEQESQKKQKQQNNSLQ